MKMPLTNIEADNFTVFDDIKIPFNKGLNILVGENGMGKTHVMKLAYAACQASKHDVSFSQKTTMLFRPDQSSIGRLVNRKKKLNEKITGVYTMEDAKIQLTYKIDKVLNYAVIYNGFPIIHDICIKNTSDMNYPSHAVQWLLWKCFLTVVTVTHF